MMGRVSPLVLSFATLLSFPLAAMLSLAAAADETGGGVSSAADVAMNGADVALRGVDVAGVSSGWGMEFGEAGRSSSGRASWVDALSLKALMPPSAVAATINPPACAHVKKF